jgi:predicted RNA-binding Zn-ribbon protein involved in translation (DUF1610 family)
MKCPKCGSEMVLKKGKSSTTTGEFSYYYVCGKCGIVIITEGKWEP